MDQTPAGLFDVYEQDFLHLIQGVREKLDGDARNQVGEQRKAALRRVEIELDEADDIVSQLEVEIQGIPTSLKPQYTSRLKQAKSELTKYKKLSKDLHAQATRGDLLGNGARRGPRSDDPYTDEPSQRDRLLTGHQTLQDGSRRLQESTGIAYQTEAYGAEILSTLRGQREQIENSSNMLNTADGNIERSSNTIGKMLIQMKKQKFMMAGIIAFFVALVILILYFKLVR